MNKLKIVIVGALLFVLSLIFMISDMLQSEISGFLLAIGISLFIILFIYLKGKCKIFILLYVSSIPLFIIPFLKYISDIKILTYIIMFIGYSVFFVSCYNMCNKGDFVGK